MSSCGLSSKITDATCRVFYLSFSLPFPTASTRFWPLARSHSSFHVFRKITIIESGFCISSRQSLHTPGRAQFPMLFLVEI